ncbi:hypothetical protein [Eubacterium sp. 1001713B170207_170306_E7]|uniref:hypothetical protein n=1 Tax=Eubacterium sp. 1001713B170207_170306_E7 TaxID=2787097 RepID=UPI00189A265C|nr:hypothetical protein [Eubacterium sp. 1001713B170207_170306_E7]
MKIKMKHTAALLLAALLAAPVRPVLAGESGPAKPTVPVSVNYVMPSYSITYPEKIDFGTRYWTGKNVENSEITNQDSDVEVTDAIVFKAIDPNPDGYTIKVSVAPGDKEGHPQPDGKFELKSPDGKSSLSYWVCDATGGKVQSGDVIAQVGTKDLSKDIQRDIKLKTYEPARGQSMDQYKGILLFTSEITQNGP